MYYVYALIDPRTQLPFYIGKGKVSNRRHLDHFTESKESTSNRHKFHKIKYLTSLGLEIPVKILDDNILDEEEAYRLEKSYIEIYGRKNIDDNGILVNICLDNKPPNKTGTKQTKEHVEKRVKSYKETTASCKRKLSDETKEKISKSVSGERNGFYGKKHSTENKKKHSLRMQGNKHNEKLYRFLSPIGEESIVSGFYNFCRGNNLIVSTMEKVLRTGKAPGYGKCKGWLVYRMNLKENE